MKDFDLPELLKASQENGTEINPIIGNAAYFGKKNIKLAAIKIVVKLNLSITQDFRKQEETFD